MKMRVIETFHSLQGQAVAPAIRMPEETQVYRFGFKRLFDICLTLMVAPVALPIILIFAFLVALDGGNPFYCQKRIGRHGRPTLDVIGPKGSLAFSRSGRASPAFPLREHKSGLHSGPAVGMGRGLGVQLLGVLFGA